MGKFSCVSVQRRRMTRTKIPRKSRTVSLCLALATILSFPCGFLQIEGNLNFKRYWYPTSSLCPDLQDSVTGKHFGKQKSVLKLEEQRFSSHNPCLLKGTGQDSHIRKALIAGIHIDTRPWNFSDDATTCTEDAKVRLPITPNSSQDDLVMLCTVPRKPEIIGEKDINDIKLTNDMFTFNIRDKSYNLGRSGWNMLQFMTPSLWEFQKSKRLVISFPSFNLSHLNGSDSEFHEHQYHHRKDFWLKPHHKNQYIQLFFTVQTASGDCNVQIQQYVVKNKEETPCENIQQRYPFQLCGVYGYDKIEEILRAIGFWDKETRQIQMEFLQEMYYWQNSIYFLGCFVLVGIMPFLFVCVWYGLHAFRTKTTSRHRHHTSSTVGFDRHGRMIPIPQYYWRSNLRYGIRIYGYYDRNSPPRSDSSVMALPRQTIVSTAIVTNHAVIPHEPVETEEPPPLYASLGKLPTYEEVMEM